MAQRSAKNKKTPEWEKAAKDFSFTLASQLRCGDIDAAEALGRIERFLIGRDGYRHGQ
jgi:hypothetical protein